MVKNKTLKGLTAIMLSVIMIMGMATVPAFAYSGEVVLLPTGGEEHETLQGLGTEEYPLRIETASQLAAFAWSVNHDALPSSLPEYPHLILVNDLDLSVYNHEDDYGEGWIPIGGYYNEMVEIYSFKGTFDGNNKTIRGLYINRDERYVGLFGYVKEGTVKNLTIEAGNITGYAATGGIVGNLYGGKVENCIFSGNVTGEDATGGIVGELSFSKVENCVNNGSISGIAATGGIVGSAGSDNVDDHIQNCVNTGAVTGNDMFTGGIIGTLVGMSLDYCVNTGIVQGASGMSTGGVSGDVFEGKIQNCVNTGDVSSNANNVGGIAGWVRTGTIQNCINYGNISNDANSVGGVAGFVESGSEIKNCLTTGNISGKVQVIESGGIGGIAGISLDEGVNKNYITGCVALGESVKNNGDMGNTTRITYTESFNTVFDNFAWKYMEVWWDGELIPEHEYYIIHDGEDSDAETLQTLWTSGALAEAWSEAGVWTLSEGKMPVLTGLPYQSNKFPSYINSITGVTVTPNSDSLQKGTTQNLTATVTGIGDFDDTVTWSLSGAMSPGTVISNSGVLIVDAAETADTLTVTATSNGDSSKKDTATITVTDVPVIKYALTVNSGSGTGEYAQGATVTLIADPAADDKLFDKWVVTSGTLYLDDARANPITITIPAEVITIGAIYKDKSVIPDPTYIVTLNGSGTDSIGSGSYTEGATVNLYSGTRSGYTFTGWTSSDVEILNADSKNASFIMPSKDVIITANWRYNGGSGGGSASGTVGSNVIINPPSPDSPNAPTQCEIQVVGKVDSSGSLSVIITEKDMANAIDKALANARKNGKESNGISIVLKVNMSNKTADSFTFRLSNAVQELITGNDIVNLIIVVDNPGISISIDSTALKEINNRVGTDVNINGTRMDNNKLIGSAKTAIGSRPVFDFEVIYDSVNKLQSFGAGSVWVTIPYKLGTNEKPSNVQAVYVDENGKVQWLKSSIYDRENGVLQFSTGHFSTYGVGYKQDAPTFTDVDTHWAKEDIEFVVNRGLFMGTSEFTFSPNIAMTRGMFVTVLGRMANADVDIYKQSSFIDVEKDSYYMEYIEWASKNNIVSGIGNGNFDPDQFITREQTAVIMQNYAKYIGFTLPKNHAEITFVDCANISDYAKEAVKQMQISGILSGKNDNIFDPQDTATRADVSAVLRRFVELSVSSGISMDRTMND